MFKPILDQKAKEKRNKLAIKANCRIKPWEIFKVQIKIKNNIYEARYHRAQYWFDDEPVTSEKTKQLMRTWHISYWRVFENGGAVEIAPNNIYSMLVIEDKNQVKGIAKTWLKLLAIRHEVICEENKQNVE